MYNDTITLFNRKAGYGGDCWFPTVLHNVNLNMDKAAILAKYGANEKDNVSLHVRYTLQDGKKKMVGEKPWLPPIMWNKLEDPSTAITFTSGTKFDFFWLGEWNGSDPITDICYGEYTDFYTFMKNTHDYVFAVSSVNGPYSAIPHFEITGK